MSLACLYPAYHRPCIEEIRGRLMELQREMESKHSAGTWAWRKWNCLVVLALKPATTEFERAFCLARKERNGSLVVVTLTLSGAPIWCSGEKQASMQSHLAAYSHESCVGESRASNTIPQSRVGNLESFIKSDSTVTHSHPQLRPVAALIR